MDNIFLFKAPHKIITSLFIIAVLSISCRKFVEVEPPKTELVKATVFSNDASAKAAIAGLYAQMSNSGYSDGSVSSFTNIGGLSSDELENYSLSAERIEFFKNSILPLNGTLNSSFWTPLYQNIFKANTIIEGLSKSTGVSDPIKNQFIGEAKFIRAFAHFYLVNLFGDIPVVLTTDYRINGITKKTSVAQVYEQIIADLHDAQNLLASDYSFSNNEKVRVNKYAATALLARVCLYRNDYSEAEKQSSAVINNTVLYNLSTLAGTFLKNSSDAIWQLSRDNGNAKDAITFTFNSTPSNAALRSSWVLSLDPKDQRKVNWIGIRISGANTFYYATKYKITTASPITEYSMVLRLAEQYLIRAEARINLPGKIAQGITDLNILRNRASAPPPNNLDPLSLALSKDDAMIALENERRIELFAEWGHRWMDLKRWPSRLSPDDNTLNRADDVLQILKIGWKKEWKLYPIPQVQILNDPAMANAQNPGY
jgi:hypothetical protein